MLVLVIVIVFMLNITITKLQAYAIQLTNNNASKYTAENIPKSLISDTLQGTIVGGIIGIGSGIVVSQIQYYIARPRISIKEETTEIFISHNHDMGYSESQSPFGMGYIATRIAVKNSGRTAAEDCKASLIIKNLEVRVAWMIPKEDFTVTINADDIEFVDLCAFGGSGRVFTTEKGYQWEEAELRGRSLPPELMNNFIEAELKVSANNAKQYTKKIWVLPEPDLQHKMVKFTNPDIT